MSQRLGGDYFVRARSAAATGMFIAGVTAITGSLLDWVTIEPPEVVPLAEVHKTQPFTGLEATDGWWVLGAGVVLIGCAAALVLRQTRGWAWLAFAASILIGAIAFADYRGIGDLHSTITQRMDVVGRASPALGIQLVAGSAVAGLIAAVAGIASVPKPESSSAQ